MNCKLSEQAAPPLSRRERDVHDGRGWMPLSAGPLQLRFDGGDLRYVKFGEREVIRRIYAAVRDRNWGTVPSEISNLKSEISEDQFKIRYTSTHRRNEIHFVWEAGIVGRPDGSIRFTFDGEAKSTFLRNRIGFCVLHPIGECAGVRCRVRRADGTHEELRFPQFVAAEQPVHGLHDLVAMAHEMEGGLWAEVEFAGDVFETEDQRNWIDASFKTFCTPLRLPFPAEIKAGTRVRQEVRLKVAACGETVAPLREVALRRPITNRPSGVSIDLRDEWGRLPSLGLGASGNQPDENSPCPFRLRALRLSHLRHDVNLPLGGWAQELEQACREAAALGLPIELAVHLPPQGTDQLAALAVWLTERQSRFPEIRTLTRIVVFGLGPRHCSSARGLRLARRHLGDLGVPIGGGSNADLYELNLNRAPADADFICWSMNPQVHASDSASIAETPEAAAQQVASVRSSFPAKPLVVSPITLRPRFNAVATGPEPPAPPGELPPQVDPRQSSLFGAVWTLAMLKVLAESGIYSATFYETTGWRGAMETEMGSPLPDKFSSIPNAVFPLYHVLADFGEFAGGEAVRTESNQPLSVTSLLLRKERRFALFLGNFENYPVPVTLPKNPSFARMRCLDASTALLAGTEPESFRSQWRALVEPRVTMPPMSVLALRSLA